jgi:hypothetical protein
VTVADELDKATVEVLVGPAAWAYHQALPSDQQVDLRKVFRVHRSQALVAAEVLTAACTAARVAAAVDSAGQLRKLKDGDTEVEYFAATNGASIQADSWCAQASVLRDGVRTATQSLADFLPTVGAWGVEP